MHPWAGFSMRYSYWLAQVIATGSEVLAASIYCRTGFQRAIVVVDCGLFGWASIYVNARSVGNFGKFEYWFSMIKVADDHTLFGSWHGVAAWDRLFPRLGRANYTAMADFFRTGGGEWALVLRWLFLAFWAWSGSGHLRRGKGSCDGRAAGIALDTWSAGTFLYRWIRHYRGICRGIKRVRGRELAPLSAFSSGRHPAAAAAYEFRGADGGAFQRQLQFVLDGSNAFFAVERRVCTGGLGRLSKQGPRWSRCSSPARECCSGLFVDHWFHAQRMSSMLGSAFWRHLRVADDICHPPCISTANCKVAKPPMRLAPRGPWSSLWVSCAYRGAYFDLVGPRSAHHTDGGCSLACVHFAVLPCVEEFRSPKISDGAVQDG